MVIPDNTSITMNNTTTITTKGQVTIPKHIRDELNLKPSDKVVFEVKDNKIVATKALSIKEMRGIFHVPGKKPLSDREMDKVIAEAVVEKFRRKGLIPKK